MHDKGGRAGYTKHSAQSSNAGGSGAGAGVGPSASNATGPTHPSGYVPAQSPQHPQRVATSSTSSLPLQSVAAPAPASTPIITRVKALYTFEPTEPGELAFEKGEVIKVVDRGYKDWWRGQLKGRTGIFPVNYVVGVFLA
jgi:signal transducing adaptor molecule